MTSRKFILTVAAIITVIVLGLYLMTRFDDPNDSLSLFDKIRNSILSFLGLYGGANVIRHEQTRDGGGLGRVLEAIRPKVYPIPPVAEPTPQPLEFPWPDENEADLISFYGERGENLVTIGIPYPMRLSWELETTVNRIQVNEKIKDSVSRVLRRVLDHYGIARIKELGMDIYGGCFNNRKKRGGDEWSTHAWAIALDFDPENNQLRWGPERARFAKPEYDFWWKCWEEEGATSLGRAAGYDFQHVQFANIA